jgi:hypothetical protein
MTQTTIATHSITNFYRSTTNPFYNIIGQFTLPFQSKYQGKRSKNHATLQHLDSIKEDYKE